VRDRGRAKLQDRMEGGSKHTSPGSTSAR
jgi:hypothetical protein